MITKNAKTVDNNSLYRDSGIEILCKVEIHKKIIFLCESDEDANFYFRFVKTIQELNKKEIKQIKDRNILISEKGQNTLVSFYGIKNVIDFSENAKYDVMDTTKQFRKDSMNDEYYFGIVDTDLAFGRIKEKYIFNTDSCDLESTILMISPFVLRDSKLGIEDNNIMKAFKNSIKLGITRRSQKYVISNVSFDTETLINFYKKMRIKKGYYPNSHCVDNALDYDLKIATNFYKTKNNSDISSQTLNVQKIEDRDLENIKSYIIDYINNFSNEKYNKPFYDITKNALLDIGYDVTNEKMWQDVNGHDFCDFLRISSLYLKNHMFMGKIKSEIGLNNVSIEELIHTRFDEFSDFKAIELGRNIMNAINHPIIYDED